MVVVARAWMSSDESSTFDELFLAEYGRVVGIARRILGDGHEAEDVAQDVFCDFYRRHPADAPYAAPWLYRAAAHTALNVVRGKKRRRRREESDVLDQSRLGLSAADDPEESIRIAEQRKEVRVALARLPEKSAAVLALRYSGLSYAEVAAALGVRTNAIGTLLRRAEAALRKEMSRETSR
jgi:RNA polymerase sigma factor (sigma-70 family)